jgi:phage terminase small subunit
LPGLIDFLYLFRYRAGIDRGRSGALPGRWQASASEHQPIMDKPTRKQLREAIQGKGIAPVLRIPKNSLTPKQRKFAEAIVLDEMTASDAYRAAYDTKGKPATVNPEASRLANSRKVAATIDALERAKELSAWHSAEALRSLVISTLTEVATSETAKDATRVAAVKVLGTVVGVDAFRETKRIEHVQDSGEIKDQIMQQLKTLMLNTGDVETVDADSLLAEIAGDDSGAADTHPTGTPQDQEWDSDSHVHTIPLEQSEEKLKASQENSDPESNSSTQEHPPSPPETPEGGGDIFGEK